MMPRIKALSALDDYLLSVEFEDGKKVIYDVKEDITTLPNFQALVDVYGLFRQYFFSQPDSRPLSLPHTVQPDPYPA